VSKLRDLRQQHNWSQAEVAERLKASRQTVNAIETDKYDPSLPLAFKIAKLFRLPIEEVFEPQREASRPILQRSAKDRA
jgi:putative transcriptional regulator